MGFWKQLIDYEHRIFGKNSIKIIQSSIGFIPDIYENEVKSMVWTKCSSNSNNNNNNNNTSLLVNAFANLAINSVKENNSGNQNINNNRTNNFESSSGTFHKEKFLSPHKSQQQIDKQTLQPIIGSCIPKFSPNKSSKMINNNNDTVKYQQSVNESTKYQALNTQYTTTYRTSYQKH